MKRILTILAAVSIALPLCAQKQKELENNEIFMTVGADVPMHKGIEGDVTMGIHYGHYYPNGLGFRAGFQYTPTVADIDNHFGVPLAFTFRTGSRSFSNRLESAAYGSIYSAVRDGEDGLRGGFFAFLMNMVDRIELHAGLTPGYVSGAGREQYPSYKDYGGKYWEKTWTEKPRSFSLSADAGMNINFRIWRFDLKIIPAFHYNLTNNYIYHIDKGERGSDRIIRQETRPIRWFFTINGGLAFRF